MATKFFRLGWLLLFAMIVGCGGDGGSNFTLGGGGNNDVTGSVSIGISDAPVDDVKEVVVEIDRITLKKRGEDDLVIEQFTSTDLAITDADTFQIDLLQYQQSNQAIVIESLELPAGQYTNLILTILDQDINSSYVVELDDSQKEIKVPSGNLKLGSFTVDDDSIQTFTIEFNLRQALTYRPGPDVYNLKPRGIRLQDNATAVELSGTVDSGLFDTEQPCLSKPEPTVGNVVYLYQGHNLTAENLADVYDPDTNSNTVPNDVIGPFAVEGVFENGSGIWNYGFGFLPAGEYTLVFSCNAEGDDPDSYDGNNIELPLPDDQLIELTLTAGADTVCDLPVVNGSCS